MNNYFKWEKILVFNIFKCIGSFSSSPLSEVFYGFYNKVITDIVDVIAEQLVFVFICFFMSLDTGIFPEVLKFIKVIPILKWKKPQARLQSFLCIFLFLRKYDCWVGVL